MITEFILASANAPATDYSALNWSYDGASEGTAYFVGSNASGQNVTWDYLDRLDVCQYDGYGNDSFDQAISVAQSDLNCG